MQGVVALNIIKVVNVLKVFLYILLAFLPLHQMCLLNLLIAADGR